MGEVGSSESLGEIRVTHCLGGDEASVKEFDWISFFLSLARMGVSCRRSRSKAQRELDEMRWRGQTLLTRCGL